MLSKVEKSCPKYGKVEKSIEKLIYVVKSWELLSKVEKSWGKLAKVPNSCPKVEKTRDKLSLVVECCQNWFYPFVFTFGYIFWILTQIHSAPFWSDLIAVC